MRLSKHESRALSLIALLLLLSIVARLRDRPAPVLPDTAGTDLAALERAAETALADERRRSTPLGPDETIDPNTAPPVELARLPGVGRAIADRIVAERGRGGPFRSADDLARVSGIGARTVERIAGRLRFARAALPRAPPSSSSPHPRSVLREDDSGPAHDPLTAGPADDGTVDLNRAMPGRLEELPGVGPVLASRIVALRDSIGGFGTIDDLQKVPGIGPKTLDRLRPMVRVEP